jgi:RNA polymerase sigma factor (sigma-70 family)
VKPAFPITRLSAIAALRSDERRERVQALETVVAAYWKPVYKYIRFKWNKTDEEAQDLTQGFFARAIEKDFFQAYDPVKARFRTFLRACLDGFVSNQDKAARRIKRGGEADFISLDFESARSELRGIALPASESAEEYFDKEWIRSLFSRAVETLKMLCQERDKAMHFQLFERYDLDDHPGKRPSYEELAREHGLSASAVTNHLAYARREFRRIVLDKLREVTASDEEFRDEARRVLGVEPE